MLALGLAFHELTTNALKYGALSHDNGALAVTWEKTGEPPREELHVSWSETFAEPIEVPTTKGFGSRLIEAAVTRELDGSFDRIFNRQGLKVAIRLPLDRTKAPQKNSVEGMRSS